MPRQPGGRQAAMLLARLRRATEHSARYPILAQLRAFGPVLRMWRGVVVLGYQEVAEVLRDADRFGPPPPARRDATQPAWRDHPAALLGADLVTLKEGDGHRAARSAMHRALADALGGDFAIRVERRIDQAVERLAAEFSRTGAVEAMGTLIEPVAAGIFADLFGVSEADTAAVLPAAWAFAKVIDEAPQLLTDVEDQAAGTLLGFAARVADGASPLRGLSPAEAVGVLGPGLVNLSAAIGNLIQTLDRFPWEREGLLGDPVATDAGVEELLRYDAPAQGTVRIARMDAELTGVPIVAGDSIMVLTAAANRDPAQWADPDVFRPSRPGLSRTLSFGHGAHSCLGRAMVQLVLSRIPARLYRRFPTLRVAEPPVVRPALLRNYMTRLVLEAR
ncbi:cytochrome P450 [Streptomyces sp. NPDC051172]|uniref:cytochrome P450 n=1 Tax=Streptomyces sp. NPDC051172 TaxID=3155796 RepID=UPI0034303979